MNNAEQDKINIDSVSKISDDEFQAKEEERKHQRSIERSETGIKNYIALFFSGAFLMAILTPVVGVTIGMISIENYGQVTLILGSIISAPFGFIMGYYYR